MDKNTYEDIARYFYGDAEESHCEKMKGKCEI